MIAGVVAFLSAQAAVLVTAHGLLLRIRTGQSHIDLVLLLLLRLGIMSATVLFAGLLGCLTPLAFGAAGLAGTGIGIALGWHRQLFHLRVPRVGLILGAIAGLVIVRLFAQVWFFAPYTSDVLTYHLPKVAEWVRAGRITAEMGLDNHAAFPAGFELIETWWVLFFHHDVFVEMAGVEFLVLLASSVFALSRCVGLSESGAGLASLLAALSPGLHHQATSCLNDAPVAALYVTSMALSRPVGEFWIHFPPGQARLIAGSQAFT